jgi:hypothetical protein
MSLLFKVIYAHRATGTHHKIAMDALRLMEGGADGPWARVFLAHADLFMRGAKAPDDEFRDSKNQVLHVRDGYWGGAEEAAENWREKLTILLKAQNWREAAFAAGVLSHYYSDPIQPLHTAQSEAEGAVHRAIEQSVGKSYPALLARLETRLGGFPKVAMPSEARWVARMVRDGAEAAAPHYDPLIDHYDLAKGVSDPPAGLDEHLQDVMAKMLGHAIVGFAAILDRVTQESGVAPPQIDLTLKGYLAALDIPIRWVLRKMADDAEADIVREMYDEFLATGKVIKTMSHDDRMVRAAHAREVLRVDLAELDAQPARKPGSMHGQAPLPVAVKAPAPPAMLQAVDAPIPVAPAPESTPEPAPTPAAPARKARFTRESPVIDAPAIGESLAGHLNGAGVATIGALLDADPDALAAALAHSRVTATTVRDWQAMTHLQLGVPELNAIEAQLLVLLGVRDATALAASDAADLALKLAAFVGQGEGASVTRGRPAPDASKVHTWIDGARSAA